MAGVATKNNQTRKNAFPTSEASKKLVFISDVRTAAST